MDLFDENNKIVSKRQLVAMLNNIMERSMQAVDPIGVLTAEHRDNWGQTYQHLIKGTIMSFHNFFLKMTFADPGNEKSVKEIQKSLFLVCLDNKMLPSGTESRQITVSKQFIHGGGSAGNAGNRWYDKTIQVLK